MTNMTLTFDAVSEANPGPKWLARWQRSWPSYEAWFIARGGDNGPTKKECREALLSYMPELVETYDTLVKLSGGTDRAARFLSTWCPPKYLGGCSIAAMSDLTDVRLVRNYDLSPDLNEGLLLRTEWTGRSVMGMVEFLWGLSDGINDAGFSVALAYGGRSETGIGFGITTILRYLLETCETVDDAVTILKRVPSHMAYNLVLADKSGATASIELSPGGVIKLMPKAVATNHQSGNTTADRPSFTRSFERYNHLEALEVNPKALDTEFIREPLLQDRYNEGFGTLFTAVYDPRAKTLNLIWRDEEWHQSLDSFVEGQRVILYQNGIVVKDQYGSIEHETMSPNWASAAQIDWKKVGQDYADNRGLPIHQYLVDNF